jgi:hypothetical protein
LQVGTGIAAFLGGKTDESGAGIGAAAPKLQRLVDEAAQLLRPQNRSPLLHSFQKRIRQGQVGAHHPDERFDLEGTPPWEKTPYGLGNQIYQANAVIVGDRLSENGCQQVQVKVGRRQVAVSKQFGQHLQRFAQGIGAFASQDRHCSVEVVQQCLVGHQNRNQMQRQQARQRRTGRPASRTRPT